MKRGREGDRCDDKSCVMLFDDSCCERKRDKNVLPGDTFWATQSLRIGEAKGLVLSDGGDAGVALSDVRDAFEAASSRGSVTRCGDDYGKSQLPRAVVDDVLRALCALLSPAEVPGYVRQVAAEALKWALLVLAQTHSARSPGAHDAVEDAQACCMRLLQQLLPLPVVPVLTAAEQDGSQWCGWVLEALLRTLKEWEAAADEMSAGEESEEEKSVRGEMHGPLCREPAERAEAGEKEPVAWGLGTPRACRGNVRSLRLVLRDMIAALPEAIAKFLTSRQSAWLQEPLPHTTAAGEQAEGGCGQGERDAAALAVSLLHRAIQCHLVPWGIGDDEGWSSDGSDDGERGGRPRGAGAGDDASRFLEASLVCLGPVTDSFGALLDGDGQADRKTENGLCGGWGQGQGWGCLRRKCAAVVLASGELNT